MKRKIMNDPQMGNVGDTVAIFAVLGTVSEFLPPIAALLAILWTAIRIYEYIRYKLGYRKDNPT
jgi:cobalamin synthase